MSDPFADMPTTKLMNLKKSIEERLAERTSVRASNFSKSAGTKGPERGIPARPLSPALSCAGSAMGVSPRAPPARPRPASAGPARPSSAGRARDSTFEPFAPTRRPMTPDGEPRRPGPAAFKPRPFTAGAAIAAQRSERAYGWERQSSSAAANRRDAEPFIGDRSGMVRPYSGRSTTVQGKIGEVPSAAHAAALGPARVAPRPPQAGAFKVRDDLLREETLLRRFYDRGDLPISVRHCPQENEINWRVPCDKLDFHYYLPIFFDGLRERQDPYGFFARRGILDMIEQGPRRVLPVLPQLIVFIKKALNTREHSVVGTTLKILQTMLKADDRMGPALVPYYRQLLPTFNLLKASNRNVGDAMDYSQKRRGNVGDLINETLEMLEMYGGPDAYINIKYMIPTYESCMVV